MKINNFKEFVNEGAALTNKHAVSIPYLKYLCELLKDKNLSTNDGRDLEVDFDEEELMLTLKAEEQRNEDDDDEYDKYNDKEEYGELTYFYWWDTHEWSGGYTEDVILSGGRVTQGGSEDPMSPEEFLEFLEEYDVIDSGDILDELNRKFPHEKTGRDYGV
jgi:hypothetical protein